MTPHQQRSAGESADSRQWTNHEHEAPAIHPVARRLVDEAGTPELAKQAIDQVATRSGSETALAEQFGAKSYLELFEASIPVVTRAGETLCLSSDSQGRWATWDPERLNIVGWYGSLDLALREVARADALPPAAAPRKNSPTPR